MPVRDVGNLRTRLSFEDDGAMNSLQRFRQDLKSLRSEMRTVTSQGKEYINSLKGLKQQQDILNRELKVHQERVKELNLRYQEAVKAKGADSEEARKLAIQYNNALAQMYKTEQQLGKVTQAIKEQENPLKNLSKDLEAAGEKFKSLGDKLSDFGKSYTVKVTAPIVAGGTAAFKAAMDYESAFAGVRKTVNATEEELAQLSKGIREMAKEMPASATEIAAVAEAAGQLGISTDNILEFTRTMINLGEATNLSAEQAATEFARFANIVGMSQKDFDRLGSSVVALGNNFATTESEISSMALRLAAQGKQIGMTEAQIVALAAAMSSLGLEAEAGGTAMTTVLKKMQTAVGEGGKTLQGFAKVARVSSQEFAQTFKTEPIKALDMFIKGLSQSSKEGENLTTILGDLGIKGIRETDTMLRLAGASDILSEAVELSTEAWKENTALANEVAQRYATTESRLKILWNRIKDLSISFGESLAPAIMDALDAAKPFFKSIENGAKAFSEMTKEQQRSILKMFALIAAVGPAATAVGGLSKAIGGVLTLSSGLVNTLGTATGGAGLLAKIAGLGTAGPVGLAIAGVGLLAGGIYALTKRTEESKTKIFEELDARKKQIEETDQLIGRYEELASKNKLSNDEILRFLDIQSELEQTDTASKIKELTDEQNKLLEKSGLTNDEMQEFIDLNGKLIDQSPETQKAISEQGNSWATNVEEVRKLNQEKLKSLQIDAEMAMQDAIKRENDLLKEQRELVKEIRENNEKLGETKSRIVELNDKIAQKEQELKEIQQDRGKLSYEEQKQREERINQLKEELLQLQGQKMAQENIYEQLLQLIDGKQEELDKNREELQQLDAAKWKYEQIILASVGLNSEKEKGLQTIENEIAKLEAEKVQLKELHGQHKLSTQEYQEQLGKIDQQIGKLKNAKGQLEEMNELAGKTIYKTVELHEKPSANQFNENLKKKLSVPISKLVRLYSGLYSYAEGTDYAPGGLSLVGEEGPELIRYKNKWALAGFGLLDLPRGAQVFTHEETNRILKAISSLKRIPAFAEGARPAGEANKIINQLSNSTVESAITPKQPVIIQLVTPDKREFAKWLVDDIAEIQRFKEARIRMFSTT